MIAGPPPIIPHVPTIREIVETVKVLQIEREWHWRNTPWALAKELCGQIDDQIRKLLSRLNS